MAVFSYTDTSMSIGCKTTNLFWKKWLNLKFGWRDRLNRYSLELGGNIGNAQYLKTV